MERSLEVKTEVKEASLKVCGSHRALSIAFTGL